MIKEIVRRGLYRFPALDSGFRRFIWSRIHFPEKELGILDSFGEVFEDVIDVGAATGNYAWVLARCSRRVFSFEPGEEHFKRLKMGSAGSNIYPDHRGVGATAGEATFFTPDQSVDGLHSATFSNQNPVSEGAGTRVVEQVSLDEYVETEGLGSVDLIKVDVEGYENEVIKGALQTIAKSSPVLICEIEKRHNPEWAWSFEELGAMGYQVYYWDGDQYREFSIDAIDALQSEDALAVRLSGHYDKEHPAYVNNFVFLKKDAHKALFGIK
ncbi:MAG: FkbM family methyltransferase [Verrucomicrobiales bacterium]|nr:FkbM family methyltransferase [Verrucomicrobiales bacterium]